MGWTTSWAWQTRKEMIKHRTENSLWYPNNGKVQRRHTCLTYCMRGNTLWTVWEVINIDLTTSDFTTHRYIGCDLIRSYGKEGYGYKDMSEADGPYYYDCPLKYLDMVQERQNLSWRQAVRDYHDRKSFNMRPGLIVGLKECIVPAVKLTSPNMRKGWWNCEARDGREFRVKRSQLSGETFETWPVTT